MKKMKKILRVSTIIIVFSLIIFTLYNFFKLREISLSDESCLKSQELNLKGKLILTVFQKSLETDLKQKYPCLSSIKIKKIYPSKLEIQVTGEKPVAQIGGTNLQITTGGFITQVTAPGLIQLYLQPEIKPANNQKIDDQLSLFTLQIASLIYKTDFHPAMIRVVNEQNIAVYDQNQALVIFTTKKPASDQVDSLQQVIAAAKIDGTKLAKIDLRFDKPVITFK